MTLLTFCKEKLIEKWPLLPPPSMLEATLYQYSRAMQPVMIHLFIHPMTVIVLQRQGVCDTLCCIYEDLC